jgi:pilus assembly protein CpaE
MVEAPKEKISILIVDDIPETRENLKKLLFFEKDVDVVGTATSGREAVQLVLELKPAVVLMDINMPDMDGIAATRSILEKAPGVQVIMMSVQGEMSYVRESMRAGAADFLIKPFTSDELVNSIHHVFEARPVVPVLPIGPVTMAGGLVQTTRQHEGKVVAVFSTKGGAGCSTVATNLACALKAESGSAKVAVWDASFQFGDIGVMLNMQPSRTIVDVLSQMADMDGDLLEGVMASHTSGVRVLLAPPEPQHADSIHLDDLTKIVDVLRQSYDYIIVDTETSLHDQVLSILDAADRIILLVTPEIPAIKNTRLFFDIAERLDYGDKVMLVLNKWDRRSGIRAEKLEGAFNHRIDGIIPFDDRTVLMSVNQGQPFVVGYKTAPISQSIFELAKHVVEALEPAPAPAPAPEPADSRPTSTSRLGRLLR